MNPLADRDNWNELCRFSIDDLLANYAKGSLSPVEVLNAHLERIEQHEETINAFVTVTHDLAKRQAKHSEEIWRKGDHAGALEGVPYAIKDLVPTAGIRTTRGSPLYRDWVPSENSPLAQLLLKSGGAMVGKTTTSEIGWKADAGNPINGASRTPYNPTLTSGGSSGGAAAGVAAGFMSLAQGGDGAGSIRIPASFCNLVGMKPGPGVVPYYPPTPLGALVANGPLARSVRDVAHLLDVMSAQDPRDSMSVVRTPGGYRGSCDKTPDKIRAYYAPSWGGRRAEPSIESVVTQAVSRLQGGGIEVEEIGETPPDRFDLMDIIWTTGFASLIPRPSNETDADLAKVIERARSYSGSDLATAHLARQEYKAQVELLLQHVDVLLTPTVAIGPFNPGSPGPESVGGIPANYLDWAWMTYSFNLSEHAAITIPCGFDEDDLPVGLQLISRHGTEHHLLACAAIVESLCSS